jgi:catechol 2,3-dioxygenase-like lactoylglutathione lyase family enzyme
MTVGQLEHVNITVTDPDKTAAWMQELFGWDILWRGDAKMGGHTIHIGSDDQYMAIYSVGRPKPDEVENTYRLGGLNHIGVVVDDLDAMEEKVRALGFTPHMHADYEPGRRFYFDDHDGIEFELVSYSG